MSRIISPNKFDANYITKTFFSDRTPLNINYGNCYHWAYLAHQIFNRCNIKLWSTEAAGGHAFIEIDGTFYDSESPNGMWPYSRLKTFERGYPWFSRRQTLEQFKKFWAWADWKLMDVWIANSRND